MGEWDSFDAQVWAEKFMETLLKNPNIKVDEELMVGWFANALMRGYDEYYRRTSEYKRTVRRALFPWWNWRRYIETSGRDASPDAAGLEEK